MMQLSKSTFHSNGSCRKTLPLATLLVLLISARIALGTELPAPVTQSLKEAGIPLNSVAIVVQGVDANQALIRHNADQAMNPASTMKLVTTYAALELLGPSYTWKTEALTDAPLGNGQPSGNLYLRGSGDPRLAQEHLWLLLRQLRTRGLKDISGDLVLDRSVFSLPKHDPAEFDNEPYRPYNAGPDALLVNLNSLQLTLHPDPTQKNVNLIVDTPVDDLHLDNRLLLTQDACGDWRERIKIKVVGEAIEISGNYAANCADKPLHLSPWTPDVQVDQVFRAIWHDLGGTLSGKVHDGLTPASAKPLAVQESPTLTEVIRDINKYSNNVMARQVFLTLSSERPATSEGARQRISSWLADKQLNMPELVLDNGSGLSRSERISASSMSQLLLAAWKSPVMPELISSLPVAGIDGTLKKRLGNSAATGRAHLKTGTIGGVRAIAGYVLDSNDKRWVFVFLINNPKAQQGKLAMDILLRWVAEH